MAAFEPAGGPPSSGTLRRRAARTRTIGCVEEAEGALEVDSRFAHRRRSGVAFSEAPDDCSSCTHPFARRRRSSAIGLGWAADGRQPIEARLLAQVPETAAVSAGSGDSSEGEGGGCGGPGGGGPELPVPAGPPSREDAASRTRGSPLVLRRQSEASVVSQRTQRRRSSVMGFEASDLDRCTLAGSLMGTRRRSSAFKSRRTLDMVQVFSVTCLREVAVLQQCNEEFVELLMECVETKMFNAGCDIIREGDPSTSVYFLIYGSADVMVGETLAAELGDGATFGEMALLGDAWPTRSKRCATVRATSLCNCRKVEWSALQHALGHFPSSREALVTEARRKRADLARQGLLPAAPGRASMFLPPSAPMVPPPARRLRRASTSLAAPGGGRGNSPAGAPGGPRAPRRRSSVIGFEASPSDCRRSSVAGFPARGRDAHRWRHWGSSGGRLAEVCESGSSSSSSSSSDSQESECEEDSNDAEHARDAAGGSGRGGGEDVGDAPGEEDPCQTANASRKDGGENAEDVPDDEDRDHIQAGDSREEAEEITRDAPSEEDDGRTSGGDRGQGGEEDAVGGPGEECKSEVPSGGSRETGEEDTEGAVVEEGHGKTPRGGGGGEAEEDDAEDAPGEEDYSRAPVGDGGGAGEDRIVETLGEGRRAQTAASGGGTAEEDAEEALRHVQSIVGCPPSEEGRGPTPSGQADAVGGKEAQDAEGTPPGEEGDGQGAPCSGGGAGHEGRSGHDGGHEGRSRHGGGQVPFRPAGIAEGHVGGQAPRSGGEREQDAAGALGEEQRDEAPWGAAGEGHGARPPPPRDTEGCVARAADARPQGAAPPAGGPHGGEFSSVACGPAGASSEAARHGSPQFDDPLEHSAPVGAVALGTADDNGQGGVVLLQRDAVEPAHVADDGAQAAAAPRAPRHGALGKGAAALLKGFRSGEVARLIDGVDPDREALRGAPQGSRCQDEAADLIELLEQSLQAEPEAPSPPGRQQSPQQGADSMREPSAAEDCPNNPPALQLPPLVSARPSPTPPPLASRSTRGRSPGAQTASGSTAGRGWRRSAAAPRTRGLSRLRPLPPAQEGAASRMADPRCRGRSAEHWRSVDASIPPEALQSLAPPSWRSPKAWPAGRLGRPSANHRWRPKLASAGAPALPQPRAASPLAAARQAEEHVLPRLLGRTEDAREALAVRAEVATKLFSLEAIAEAASSFGFAGDS